MKNKIKVKFSLVFLIGFFANCIQIFSQSLGNSPYSSIGLGERLPLGYSENQAMAGVGVASSLGIYYNPLNPALLAYNTHTIFTMGMIGQGKGLKTATENQNSFAMNLNYVNLSFPVKRNWSMGISIQPYSYTDLSLKSLGQAIPGDTTNYVSNFKAKGGINKLALNNAWKYKEFAFGIESAVLFGQIKRNTDSQILNDNQFYIVNFNDKQSYGGIYLKMGASLHHKLKKDKYLNLGIAWEPSKNINGERVRTTQIFDQTASAISEEDTLANSNINTKIKLPSDLRFGISLENTFKSTIFLDFAMSKNSLFKNLTGQNEGLRDSYTLGIGGEYYPSFTSIKFLKRAVYRAGFNFGTSPYSHIKTGEQLKDMNFSMGIGLPLRNLSYINLAYTAGRRGTKADGGILENYNKISIGFSLQDVWFVKQKID